MRYHTEEKFQGWRALAVFPDGSGRMLYVGRSAAQVRAGYAAAFSAVLDEEERARVRAIDLQCWQGVADQGHWVPTAPLDLPPPAGPGAPPRNPSVRQPREGFPSEGGVASSDRWSRKPVRPG